MKPSGQTRIKSGTNTEENTETATHKCFGFLMRMGNDRRIRKGTKTYEKNMGKYNVGYFK